MRGGIVWQVLPSNAVRPASTASLNGRPISTGLGDTAIAVFTSTAAAPISMAAAAWGGSPDSGIHDYRDVTLFNGDLQQVAGHQPFVRADRCT